MPTVAIASFMGLAFPVPASAEVVHTLWALQPSQLESKIYAKEGEKFYSQRLLPIRLVELMEPALDGQVPAGTKLYLVYNDAGQVGFCTSVDRSTKQASKSLFIPAGNKRPCFTDRSGDGKFDAVFMVFDLLRGPPKVGGNIRDAAPMAPVRFREIEPSTYGEDMRMYYVFDGSSVPKVRMTVSFENAGERQNWETRQVKLVDGRYAVDVLNSTIVVDNVVSNDAEFSIIRDPNLFIKRVRTGIEMISLPPFLEVKR